MKTLSLLLSGLLLSAFVARADVIIWKQKFTVTKTGAGVVSKGLVTGWLVYDVQSNVLVTVKAYPARFRFNVEQLSSELSTISAPKGKKIVAVAVNGNGTGGLSARGVASSVTIGPFLNQTFTLPRLMTVSGANIFTDTDTEHYLQTYAGVFTYSKDTFTANSQTRTLQEVIDAARNFLIEQGYEEEF